MAANDYHSRHSNRLDPPSSLTWINLPQRSPPHDSLYQYGYSPHDYADEPPEQLSHSTSSYSEPPTAKPWTNLTAKYDNEAHDIGFTPSNRLRSVDNQQYSYRDPHNRERWKEESRSSDLFENPNWTLLAFHILACACAYPILLLICLIASNKTLFWSRVIVGVGCGLLGFALGRVPYAYARRYLEASAWATFIHESTSSIDGGVRLRELSQRMDDPMGVYSAFQLLYARNFNAAFRRRARRVYDKKPWTSAILFFIFLVVFCATVTFVLGRLVDINTFVEHRHDVFDEVPVFADLTDGDINQSNLSMVAIEAFHQTWTLTPFASFTSLPKPVPFNFENETVYFAETYTSQLRTDGTGIGTFDLNFTSANTPGPSVEDAFSIVNNPSDKTSNGLVQFPKWGLRIACDSIADIQNFVVPVSQLGNTYVFVPKSLVEQLFSRLSLEMPPLPTTNISRTIGNDVLPITAPDADSIATTGLFNDNGVAHSLFTVTLDHGDDGNGWTTLEVLLVRLNETLAPSGSFPLNGTPPSINASVGYDVAVCIEAYEPWIIESYNSSGLLPTSTRIVGKANQLPDVDSSEEGGKRETKLNDIQRTLNSTGKFTAFATAHDNSVNIMDKDNGRDFPYVPSPLLVSFTNGSGPSGYTALSPQLYESARASADSTNVLAYLAGSKQLVGRKYTDRTLATASINRIPAIAFLSAVLLLGVASGVLVPRLPLGVPRRGFDLLSWIAVLHGDGLIEQLPHEVLKGTLGEKLDLRSVDERIGSARLRYRYADDNRDVDDKYLTYAGE